MAKEKMENQEASEKSHVRHGCPFCAMAEAFEERKEEHQDFFEHLYNAEAEILKALRSLIDRRLEKCQPKPKKATKIKVD